METKGSVFEIQHLASFDGPVIRTVIYLKGCPLHCLWCHNPEGMSKKPQMFYNSDHCTACGECARVCPGDCHRITAAGHSFFRDHCLSCGKCAKICFSHALEQVGKTVTVKELLGEILADLPFFQKQSGGLTLSGGEPLMQPEFACSLLAHAKELGIHTCIETSGFCDRSVLEKIAPVTDLFLFDVKETDPALHKKFTGVSNERILENLEYLDRIQSNIILRCPVIPDLNMRRDHFDSLAALAQRLSSVSTIELVPYHPIGLAKYQALAMTPGYVGMEFLEGDSLQEVALRMGRITEKPIRLSNGEALIK